MSSKQERGNGIFKNLLVQNGYTKTLLCPYSGTDWASAKTALNQFSKPFCYDLVASCVNLINCVYHFFFVQNTG